MIFVTDECVEVYDFLKIFFRMCIDINNHVPVRPWFDDPDVEEQWGCGYRDDMIAQFEQDVYNKNFTLQDQGEEDEIDTLENRTKIWSNIISSARGPVSVNFHDYGYNDEELDNSVSGAKRFPEIAEVKKLLDILRSKRLKSIKIFINEIYSEPPKKNYVTNKTDVHHIDSIWSLDILDLKDCGPENNRGYRYVLVIIDNFSKYVWTVPIKNKNATAIKASFENILISSKRKPDLFEIDRGKGFYKVIFQDFLKKTISKFILEILP